MQTCLYKRWVWGLTLAMVGGNAAAIAGTLSEGRPSVAMPPLAEVTRQGGDSGKWNCCGELAGAPVVAARDFDKSLRAHGWWRRQSLGLGRAGTPVGDRLLEVWARGDQRLLLLLWPATAGRSGFAVGTLKEGELAVDVVQPPVLAPADFDAYINGVSRAASDPYGDKVGEGEKGQEQP
ncbi:MAG: hypothetical protein WC708_05440 [Lentisphaeria bacterium]